MCIKIHLICRYCTQTYPKYDSILPCRLPNQAGQASDSPLTRPSFRFDTPPAYSPSISGNSPARAYASNFSLPSSPAPLHSNPISIPRSDSVTVRPPTPAGRIIHQEGEPLTDSPTLGVIHVLQHQRTSALNPIPPPRRSSLQSSSPSSSVVSPLSAEGNGHVTPLRPAPQMPRRVDTPTNSQVFTTPVLRDAVQTPRPSSQVFTTPQPRIGTQKHRASVPPALGPKPRYSPNVHELARQCKAYERRWAYVTCSKCGDAESCKIAAGEEYQLARKMRRVEIERGMTPINLDGVLGGSRVLGLGEGEEAYRVECSESKAARKKKKKGACGMM